MKILFELITYFIIYSFCGWIIESVFKSICQRKIINSGFLNGPFCPIYGIGAIIMYLLLQDFKGNPILIFCLGFVVLSIWEYIVGVLLEKIFKTKYWDYSSYKYNLQGRVCLTNSIFWGILGLVFINYVHPFMQTQLSRVDSKIILYADIILSIYLIVDAIISMISVLKIDQKLKNLEEINKNIKDRLEEIKLIGKNAEKSQVENIQKVIDELNHKKDRIRRRLYRRVYRLKKAFPNIKSDKITEILNLKDELRKRFKKEERKDK